MEILHRFGYLIGGALVLVAHMVVVILWPVSPSPTINSDSIIYRSINLETGQKYAIAENGTVYEIDGDKWLELSDVPILGGCD